MQEKTYSVKFYANGNGRSPVADFVNKLNAKEKATFMRLVELHKEFGVQLGQPHTRQVRGKVWELKMRHAKRAFRFFFFINDKHEIIYLHAIVKGRTSLPNKDIEIATRRMEDCVS